MTMNQVQSVTTSPEKSGTTVEETVFKTIKHHWTISHLYAKSDVEKLFQTTSKIQGPSFTVDTHKWCLSIVKRSAHLIQGKSSTSISVDLELQPPKPRELWITVKVSLIDGNLTTQNGSQMISQIQLCNIAKEICQSTWFQLMSPLRTDMLTILAEITILKGAGGQWYRVTVPPRSLKQDLKNATDFCGDMKGKDVTLVVSDEYLKTEATKFGAHKFMLAARSPVFESMFEHEEMIENKSNEVKIEDISPDVVKEMLTFIYTGEVPNIRNMASGLLYAADKYQIERLKVLCEQELAIGISVANAAEYLVLAHKHSAEQLKEIVLEFIAVNGREVMETEQWESVKALGGDVVAEILETIYKHTEICPPAFKKQRLDQ